MDWASKALNKAVSTGGIEKLLARGLTEDHFEGTDAEVYGFLRDHVRNYKVTPEPKIVKDSFPDYDWETVTEPIEYVLDQFVASVKRREAVKSFKDLSKIIDKDQYEDISRIDEIFLEKAQGLTQVIPSSSVSRFSQMPQRIDTYKARKKEGIVYGVPYGVPLIDDDTLGIHPHQYITVAGFTGVGKSSAMVYFAVNQFLEGHNPMIISLEMDEEEIYRKLDAVAVQLKQHALKAMTLSHKDVERWENFAERCERVTNDIIVIDADFATVEKVYAETSRWKPDVVYVDYVQLLMGGPKNAARWEKIDHNVRMLKAQAKQLRVPIVGLSQTNAEGETEGARIGNMGGAKSISNHSDVVLGLFQDEDMRDIEKMEISIEKNRMGPRGRVIPVKWSQSDSIFRPWKSQDAFQKAEV